MRESLFGFSKGYSQSTASFNPVLGLSDRSQSLLYKNLLELTLEVSYSPSTLHPKLMSLEDIPDNMPLDKRVSHTELVVKDCCQAKKSPMHDDWFGTVEIQGDIYPFQTDLGELEINEKYHIIYELIETRTGEPGIKIHDMIA